MSTQLSYPWQSFFTGSLDFKLNNNEDSFRVYYSSTPQPTEIQTIFFFIHGGGLTSLSWAYTIKIFREKFQKPNQLALCYDMRGHGNTYCKDETNLSSPQLIKDTCNLLDHLILESQNSSIPKITSSQTVKIILIGHSLGGSIAIKTALAFAKTIKYKFSVLPPNIAMNNINSNSEQTISKTPLAPLILSNSNSASIPNPSWGIGGLIVVEMVEGTAISGLSHLKNFFISRPSKFEKVDDAITWALSTAKIIKNPSSAKLSIPDSLKISTGKSNTFEWRTNFLEKFVFEGKETNAIEQFANSWFENISSEFLEFFGPKMLVVANMENLDKKLTIAHMQGKFMLKAEPGAGHHLMEDAPEKFAAKLFEFVRIFVR